jgi:hypothetical protein
MAIANIKERNGRIGILPWSASIEPVSVRSSASRFRLITFAAVTQEQGGRMPTRRPTSRPTQRRAHPIHRYSPAAIPSIATALPHNRLNPPAFFQSVYHPYRATVPAGAQAAYG